MECIQLINYCITYKHGVNVSFFNNYTCRFIVVISYVYMGDRYILDMDCGVFLLI